MTSTQPGRILLVEDDPNDMELTLYALQEAHVAIEIDVARDGAEALDYLFGSGKYAERDLSEVPFLVLLDVKLPKINGLEVLARVRKNPLTRSIPVVILSSSREDQDISRAYEQHANSYVVKPVDFNRFREVVTRVGVYWMKLNEIPMRKSGAGP